MRTTHVTRYGRVVYDRKPHKFTPRDVRRVFLHVLDLPQGGEEQNKSDWWRRKDMLVRLLESWLRLEYHDVKGHGLGDAPWLAGEIGGDLQMIRGALIQAGDDQHGYLIVR